MTNEHVLAKFQSVFNEDVYLVNIPSDFGRKHKSIIEKNPETSYAHIGFHSCSSIAKEHGTIYYDVNEKSYKIQATAPLYMNNTKITKTSGLIELSNFDMINFPCYKCPVPHIYYFMLPYIESYSTNIFQNNADTEPKMTQDKYSKTPNYSLSKEWNSLDKEHLKKYLLMFGYGRWNKIKNSSKASGGVLYKKPQKELVAFASNFIISLIESLSHEEIGLKNFLRKMGEHNQNDMNLPSSLKLWGPSVGQLAIAYGKRLQLLFRVNNLIDKFKTEKTNREYDPETDKNLYKWENLLQMLPKDTYCGSSISTWWEKKHDIDLLRSTYKYGYANYSLLKSNTSFSFYEQIQKIQDFPSANNITRRLKKLVQIIIKSQSNKSSIIEKQPLTIWSEEEKSKLLDILIDFGVPLNKESKNNWSKLNDKLTACFPHNDKKNACIERMVEWFSIQSKKVLEGQTSQENFELSQEKALLFKNRLKMFRFLRKYVLSEDLLIEKLQDNLEETPFKENWSSNIHDRALVHLISKWGFKILELISDNKQYGFQNIIITAEEASDRIDFLYNFFKSIFNKTTTAKSKSSKISIETLSRKGVLNCNLERDNDDNFITPFSVSPSLQLVNIGKINANFSKFHTEKNLFPIGYKAIRKHQSMFYVNQKADYTCEIIDGFNRPLFKVTSNEDPDHPIIKEHSTTCWHIILNLINKLKNNTQNKGNVSGTERFGLMDPYVIKLIQGLPQANACQKYIWKDVSNIKIIEL